MLSSVWITFVLSILDIALTSESDSDSFSDYPQEDEFLRLDNILSNYGSSERRTARCCIMDIPAECWRNCLEFASPQIVIKSRLISRHYANEYKDFMKYMNCRQTMNLCHLVDGTRFQTMEDIKESIVLIPGASLYLCPLCLWSNSVRHTLRRHSCIIKNGINSLRHFHDQSQNIMVRGLDTSSKQDFLSILLQDADGNEKKLLLICTFDAFGIDDSRSFLFEGDNLIRKFDGPDIINLQRLLVKQHGPIAGVLGVWTMESKCKRCTRICRNTMKELTTKLLLSACIILIVFLCRGVIYLITGV